MRATSDPDENLRRASESRIRPPRAAPRSPACPSCSAPSISARPKTRPVRPRRADPRAGTEALAALRASSAASSCRLALREARRRASTTTRRSSSTPTARSRGLYRKMHIPDDPLYYEKYYFTPGDLGFQAFETSVGTGRHARLLGPVVSRGRPADRPEGGRVLFYPTAIGWHPAEKAEFGEAQADAWETMQRAHAISNGVFVAAVNRVGHEGPADGGLEFWGGSFLADPFGRVLAAAGRDAEEILIVDLRPQAPGRDPPALAVPPRPPDRRLRADHPAVPRLSHESPRGRRMNAER